MGYAYQSKTVRKSRVKSSSSSNRPKGRRIAKRRTNRSGRRIAKRR